MIVVCVEAIAEVATASSTTQSQPPSTSRGQQREDRLLLVGVPGQPAGAGEGDDRRTPRAR